MSAPNSLWNCSPASLGLALFFGLPQFGYTGVETCTAVFLYESLAQLAFVYPSRRSSAYGLIAGALAVSVLGATISARLTSEKI